MFTACCEYPLHVSGNLSDDNIVWGNGLDDGNTVWGNSTDGDSLEATPVVTWDGGHVRALRTHAAVN